MIEVTVKEGKTRIYVSTCVAFAQCRTDTRQELEAFVREHLPKGPGERVVLIVEYAA